MVIIGGGAIGCETALFLSNLEVLNDQSFAFLVYHEADDFDHLRKQLYKGSRKITVLEVADRMAGNVGVSTRWSLLKNLRLLGVELRSGVRITRVEEDAVIIETETGSESIPADTIIIAVGSQSVNDLAGDVKTVGTQVVTIGDAKEPRRITDAVREGFDTAMTFSVLKEGEINMNEVVIVSGTRTPVGDLLGALKDLNCVELGVIALKAAMEQAKIEPTLIEEVVCGNPDMAGPNQTRGDRLQSMQDVVGIR